MSKELKTISKEQVEQIAIAFSKVLREWLTAQQMKQVIAENKKNNYVDCCTHDFIDANMAMDKAFKKTLKRNFCFGSNNNQSQHEIDTDAFNNAWDIAKKNDFYTNGIYVLFIEGAGYLAKTQNLTGVVFTEDIALAREYNKAVDYPETKVAIWNAEAKRTFGEGIKFEAIYKYPN